MFRPFFVNGRVNVLRHLAIVVFVLAVKIDARSSRIINGTDDTIEHRPYMVSLEYNGTLYCGGSIISKSYILTAGHCIGWYGNKLLVRSGTSFTRRGGSLSQVAEYFLPRDFAGNKRKDIALLKLKEPLEFGPTRRPIELFNVNEKLQSGAKAVVSGWGKTSVAEWSEQLQSVNLPIVDFEDCAKIYGSLSPGQICAGYLEGGKDSCKRDSGGPLVVDGRQAGVVSTGYGCAQPKYPGIYTEVAHFREWIDGYVAEDV